MLENTNYLFLDSPVSLCSPDTATFTSAKGAGVNGKPVLIGTTRILVLLALELLFVGLGWLG